MRVSVPSEVVGLLIRPVPPFLSLVGDREELNVHLVHALAL